MKDGAVRRVNNNTDTTDRCGKSPQDPRFGGVGVDNIIVAAFNDPDQMKQCPQVPEEVNASAERGNADYGQVEPRVGQIKVPIDVFRLPGDQVDLELFSV